MPINGSENKSVTANNNSSTSNIDSITVNNTPNSINNTINTTNNAPLESYNLEEEELAKEGVLNRDDLDFSRIANTAGNAKEGNFVNVKNPEYWGDNADLTYKVRDDGTVAISEDGVILGFTDLQCIRIKEADSSKEEQIVAAETSEVSNEVATETIQEEVKEEPVEVKEEQQMEQPKEETTEVLEEVAQPQVEEQIEVIETPQPSNDASSNTIAVPGDLRQTGICRNNTPYSSYYSRWKSGTNQRIVADMWNEAGRTNDRGIATLNGRYLVATTPTFGVAGDIIDVVLRDGTVIPCIIADAKGAGPTNTYGHVLGGGGTDIIEWEAYGAKEDIILGEWENKGVSKIINKGSILTN